MQNGILNVISNLVWRWQFSQSFVPMRQLLERVAMADFSSLPVNKFIRYSDCTRWYQEDAWRILVRKKGVARELCLPYKVEVNYVIDPQTKIVINEPIGNYKMPAQMRRITDSSLAAYLQEKPQTFDGAIVRVHDFLEAASGFQCKLQRATYYDAVRTELTLDFPNAALRGQTLRASNLKHGHRLPSFRSSKMANALGVSALIYLENPKGLVVFCKRRHQNVGVYEGMFGSVGGVCEFPPDCQVTDLESLARKNIEREFECETGLKSDSSVIKRLIPLAFCRDLIRGGKPQFFYLIQLHGHVEWPRVQIVSLIRGGPAEFHKGWRGQQLGASDSLSPEFVTSVILALLRLQKEKVESAEILELISF